MLNTELFEFAEIHCANDYIMAREERSAETALKYIKNHKLRIENLIFKPKTNQIRFMFFPCRANDYTTEVFNVNNVSTQFLRLFWELGIAGLQNVITQYMLQSDLKQKYEDLKESERLWVTTVILGSKEE